jgi:hypothetical protein
MRLSLLLFLSVVVSFHGFTQTTVEVYDTPGVGVFTVPWGVSELVVECWGAGGAGARATTSGSSGSRAGGGGGAYARKTIAVSTGQTFQLRVGQGGISFPQVHGENTLFDVFDTLVLAAGGRTASFNSTTSGLGGKSDDSVGDVKHDGGDGGGGGGASASGGGGGAGGTIAAGGDGHWSGTAGAGGNNDGGNGASGVGACNHGNLGQGYGGGGSGARFGCSTAFNGGNGANGAIRISYSTPVAPVILSNSTSNQVIFDNSNVKKGDYRFRVQAPQAGGDYSEVQIEINTASDFTGTSYSQNFTGTYSDNQQDEFNCNSLSPVFPEDIDFIYYARARYFDGVSWSMWSNRISFVLNDDCEDQWRQEDEPQFYSGISFQELLDEFNYGETGGYQYNGSVSWNTYVTIREITVSEEGLVNRLNVYLMGGIGGFGTAPCGQVQMALYDNAGNKITETAAVDVVNAWNGLPTTTFPTITPGTYYIASTLSCGNVFMPIRDGSNSKYKSGHTFGDGPPDTIDLATFDDYGYDLIMNISMEQRAKTLTTRPISFDSFLGADSWDEINLDLEPDILVRVLYDNSGVMTLVPDGDIANNSLGFSGETSIDISGLNKTTYHTLYLKAFFYDENNEILQWSVSPAYPQSTKPDALDGGGTFCYGTAVTLSVDGGSLETNHQWAWFNHPDLEDTLHTGNTFTVSPQTTTTYYVAAIDQRGCTSSLPEQATVTIPALGTVLAQHEDVATCIVNSNNFVHFYSPEGRYLLSINSNGEDLGNVTATAFVEGDPILVSACNDPNPNFAVHIMQRYWLINVEHQPDDDVFVRLPFLENEYDDLAVEANDNQNDNDNLTGYTDLKLSKYSGPDNVDGNPLNNCVTDGGNDGTELFQQTNEGLVSSYIDDFHVSSRFTQFTIDKFSEFHLHGSGNDSPLPVELLYFDLKCLEDNLLHFEWVTLSEQNSSHFEIQMSQDLLHWETLFLVQSIEFSTTSHKYQEQYLYSGGETYAYFRLVQRDLNGMSTDYPAKYLNLCSNNYSFSLYPNPARHNLTIEQFGNSVYDELDVLVYQMDGKIVSTYKAYGRLTQIDLSNLSKGMYMFVFRAKNEVIYREKIVVVH